MCRSADVRNNNVESGERAKKKMITKHLSSPGRPIILTNPHTHTNYTIPPNRLEIRRPSQAHSMKVSLTNGPKGVVPPISVHIRFSCRRAHRWSSGDWTSSILFILLSSIFFIKPSLSFVAHLSWQDSVQGM